MINIFLESDQFSHKAGVTKHATNSLARKITLFMLHIITIIASYFFIYRPISFIKYMYLFAIIPWPPTPDRGPLPVRGTIDTGPQRTNK